MESKVRAARRAAKGGIAAVVAGGAQTGILAALFAGRAAGTLFTPEDKPLTRRRQWLAFASRPKGRIVVDAGAREALVSRSKSLLASGVRGLSGAFEAGDVISLVEGGVEFARGLSNFAAGDLDRVKGLKSGQIEAALGHKPSDEVVHHDNLAVLKR